MQYNGEMIPFDVVTSAADTAKKSVIPVSVGLVIVYVVAWAVHIDGAVATNISRLDKQSAKIDGYNATVGSIDRRLSRIEGALDIIERPHHERNNPESE